MSAHTPGPWTLCRTLYGKDDTLLAWHIAGALHGSSLPICVSDKFGEFRDLEQEAANARLIAAAPDMLAALQRVVQDWRHPYDDGEFEDGEMPALDMARAALAACTREKQS